MRAPRGATPITDPEIVRERYAVLRPQVLIWTTIGYAMFYFVRKNLSVAMPVMGTQLGITKTDLGTILSVHGVLYGVSKFGNGIVADRANARVFMPLALAVSAILNVCFGLSSALMFFGLFWMLNGWVQGMGYPPCARLLTHWFAPKEIATKMAFWNASHTLGGAGILVLCGYLVKNNGNWRLCFFVPAGIALIAAVLLYVFLRDTPESVGLPGVENAWGQRGGGNTRARHGRSAGRERPLDLPSISVAAGFFEQVHLARVGGQLFRVHHSLCRL